MNVIERYELEGRNEQTEAIISSLHRDSLIVLEDQIRLRLNRLIELRDLYSGMLLSVLQEFDGQEATFIDERFGEDTTIELKLKELEEEYLEKFRTFKPEQKVEFIREWIRKCRFKDDSFGHFHVVQVNSPTDRIKNLESVLKLVREQKAKKPKFNTRYRSSDIHTRAVKALESKYGYLHRHFSSSSLRQFSIDSNIHFDDPDIDEIEELPETEILALLEFLDSEIKFLDMKVTEDSFRNRVVFAYLDCISRNRVSVPNGKRLDQLVEAEDYKVEISDESFAINFNLTFIINWLADYNSEEIELEYCKALKAKVLEIRSANKDKVKRKKESFLRRNAKILVTSLIISTAISTCIASSGSEVTHND